MKRIFSILFLFLLAASVVAQDRPGQTQDAALDGKRIGFAPTVVRYANLAAQDVSTWSGLPGQATVTTGVKAPDSTNTAATLSIVSPITGGKFVYNAGRTLKVGDWLVFGTWVKAVSVSPPGASLDGQMVARVTADDPSLSFQFDIDRLNYRELRASARADTEWEWVTSAARIIAAPSSPIATVQFELKCSIDASLSFYGPVLHHITAGEVTDSEATSLLQNLYSVPDGIPVGGAGLLRGQTLYCYSSGSYLPCGIPTGSNTQILFNDSGTFGADADFTWNKTTNALTVTGTINGLTLTNTTGTFTLANGKTFTVNNSITLAGTDSTTITLPATTSTVASVNATTNVIPYKSGATAFSDSPLTVSGTALTASGNLTVSGKTFSLAKYAVHSSATFATGANTTETDFGSWTIPIATLATNDDFAFVEGHGLTAINANNKRIRAYVGGTLVLDTTDAFSGGWSSKLKVIRISSTSVKVQVWFFGTTNSGTITNNDMNINTIGSFAVSNLDSNTLLVKFTGTNGTASANDITFNWLDAAVLNF